MCDKWGKRENDFWQSLEKYRDIYRSYVPNLFGNGM